LAFVQTRFFFLFPPSVGGRNDQAWRDITRQIRDSLTSQTLHEIMIADEY